MSTSSDDVRGYIAGLEADRRALAEVRAMIDVFRRNVLPDSSVTNRAETDAEVIARLAAEPKFMHADVARFLDCTPVATWDKLMSGIVEARAGKRVGDKVYEEGIRTGIRTGLRAASFLASDHDCGDEHDACLNALATKILGTTAEGAASLVEAYDRLQQEGSYHLAPGATGPVMVGDPVCDHLGREVGKVVDPANVYSYRLTEVNAFGVETPPSDKPITWSRPIESAEKTTGRYFTAVKIQSKPCPMKDCDLPCDDGHKHIVEKTDEPRPPETATIPGPKRLKLRAGQIWRTSDGTEIAVTIKPPSSLRSKWQLGAEAVLTVDADDTITDLGGCTLVYDPRGEK